MPWIEQDPSGFFHFAFRFQGRRFRRSLKTRNRREAELLSALMHRFQPEGGHVPITAGDPLAKKAVAGILLLKVSLEQLDGKAKLAQNRTPLERQRLMASAHRISALPSTCAGRIRSPSQTKARMAVHTGSSVMMNAA